MGRMRLSVVTMGDDNRLLESLLFFLGASSPYAPPLQSIWPARI